jgi:hypothetical protein
LRELRNKSAEQVVLAKEMVQYTFTVSPERIREFLPLLKKPHTVHLTGIRAEKPGIRVEKPVKVGFTKKAQEVTGGKE